MSYLFISAFVLGLIFNAVPGAVFAESLRRGLHGGYSSALKVQFGSLVGDATWAILGLLGTGLLFQIPTVRTPLTLLGAAYLAYLGCQAFRHSSLPAITEVSRNVMQLSHKGALTSGMVLSLTNPANVFYWAALGGVLGGLGVAEPSVNHYIVFFLGFMASSIAWCFICAGMIHGLRRAMSENATKYVNWMCGVALLYLAVHAVSDLLK
jgi:chemosensory pili system protein ChpE